jgi:hypothetical protein
MIPLHHEYMKTFLDYQDTFGGADRVLLMVKAKQGDVFNKDTMATIKGVTEEVFYVKGVERSSVTSIFTPNVRYTEVIEGGFLSGNITPATYAGTPEDLALVKKNVLKSDWYGRIVSPDLSAVLVAATLQERDIDTGERFDLRQVGHALEDIRVKYEIDKVSVSVIGFAKASGDIADGASNVLIFFVAAFVITAILLLWYSGSFMLTAWALVAAGIPVIWLLGILPLLGLGLDPMSILVPFLIFAIGVSHAVQMTNAWKLETLAGADGVTASRNCFLKLFVPGATALAANALGFMVIAVVDIEIVRELAFTSTIGVTVMIMTNKVLLPILLSYMKFSSETAKKLRGNETAGFKMWEAIGPLATKKGALIPMALALGLVAFGLYHTKDLRIGDAERGVPELRADSRYNRDVDQVTNTFAIGLDMIQVIAVAKGDNSPCLKREVQDKIEKFDFTMRQVDGVAGVRSVAQFINATTQDFAEGWYKWRMMPETVEQIAQAISFSTRLGNEFRNSACNAMPISIFTTDHKATTISHVVAQI